jgi:hypothetical protein
MKTLSKIAFAFTPAILILSGCSDQPAGSDAVTETRMDDVDKIEGSISDDMVATDRLQSSDAIVPGTDTPPPAPKSDTKPGETGSSGDKPQVSQPSPGAAGASNAAGQTEE